MALPKREKVSSQAKFMSREPKDSRKLRQTYFLFGGKKIDKTVLIKVKKYCCCNLGTYLKMKSLSSISNGNHLEHKKKKKKISNVQMQWHT